MRKFISHVQAHMTALLKSHTVFDLVLMVKQYASYLQDAAQRMRIIHSSHFPVRNGHDDIAVEDFEATLHYSSNYEPLASLL